jgi:hypothetical protein
MRALAQPISNTGRQGAMCRKREEWPEEFCSRSREPIGAYSFSIERFVSNGCRKVYAITGC